MSGEDVQAPRCTGTLGSKPSWMSWGQYDPCRCRLDEGHGPVEGGDNGHWCEHLGIPDPRHIGICGNCGHKRDVHGAYRGRNGGWRCNAARDGGRCDCEGFASVAADAPVTEVGP